MKIEDKNRGFWSGRCEEDKETRMWCEGNWKVLKNYLPFNLIFAKHAFFATQLTHEWVVKLSRQNPLNLDFEIESSKMCEKHNSYLDPQIKTYGSIDFTLT